MSNKTAYDQQYPLSQICSLPLVELEPDTTQPRKYFDENALQELAASIKAHGVLQPILFRIEDDKLYIVAGERRWRASKIAEQKNIPAIRVEKDFALVALAENITREALTAMEEAEALQQVIDKDGIKQVDLAKALGKGESTISEILKLSKLPDKIKTVARSDKRWNHKLLLRLAKQEDAKKQYASFYQIKKRFSEGKPAPKSKTDNGVEKKICAQVKALNKSLKEILEDPEQANAVEQTLRDDLIPLMKNLHSIMDLDRSTPCTK